MGALPSGPSIRETRNANKYQFWSFEVIPNVNHAWLLPNRSDIIPISPSVLELSEAFENEPPDRF